MSGTIENTNNLILIKLKCLQDVAHILLKCDIEVPFIKNIKDLSDDYEMGSVKIVLDYFLMSQNSSVENTDMYFKKYQMFLRKENIPGKIVRFYMILKNTIAALVTKKNKQIKKVIREIKDIFAIYDNYTIVQNSEYKIYNKCDKCSREMQVISNLSEIVCVHCGITEKLYGTVFEDDQYYYQEGQRSKHGSYDPSKHCRIWIDRIQARESKEIPEKVLTKVRNCIKDNNIRNLEEITCSEIRGYLSQGKFSIYNEHVPLIRKMITGKSPEVLTDQEIQLITIYFDKVIRVYNDTKPDEKNNVPYHPYLIYKIIEHILYSKSKNDYYNSKARIFSILSCIHLQSHETLITNDSLWQQICHRIEEIEYRPTDRNAHYNDF